LTHYIDNRRVGPRIGRELDVPQHLCPDARPAAGESCTAFTDVIDSLAENTTLSSSIRLGRFALGRLAHSMADTLITPINDSFLDFDARHGRSGNLRGFGRQTLCEMVQDVRRR
jgi:chromosome partitioning protein